jgi:hypothetical protein
MKRKILTITLLFCSFALQSTAQIKKGFWMFGGSGSITASTTTSSNIEYKYSSIILKPRAGYFFMNQLAAGLNLEYSSQKSGIGSPTRSSSKAMGIGPFIRYYILPPEKMANLLFELNGNYSKNVNSKDGFYQYSFLCGFVIFLNSSVAVEILLGYQGGHSTGSTTKTVSRNFITNIGLQVHLERNRE